ncbi:MAG: ABC transporter permease [Emergencia sp.]|nr:ABC transporter permease [Emergencia sp.]
MKKSRDFLGWIVPAAVLILWQVIVTVGAIPAYKLPSPVVLVQVLWDFITGSLGITPYSGTCIPHLLQSLRRVVTGFCMAAAIGMPLGFITGRIPLMKRLFDPFIHAIRSIPGIGWLPIAIVWFGVGEGNTLFLIALATFFPIYVNTAHGASEISEMTIRAGQMMGAKGFTLFRTVLFPAAFPQIAVGLRLGLGVAWGYLVLGEVTGVNEGLGAVMTDGRMLGHVDIVLATMIVIAVCGKLTDLGLMWICRRCSPQIRKGGSR